MAMKTNKGKEALFTEINITPLTDIFLVLLIIMMVVAPTFQSNDTSITIPEINSGVSIEQKNATVAVTKDGEMYLNGNPVNDDTLVQELVTLKEQLETPVLVVQDAEYKKLIVAGEPLSKKEQKSLKEKKNNIRGNNEQKS